MSEPEFMEVMEESSRGKLRVIEFNLGENRVEAYYTEHPEPAAMAIQPGLPDSRRRALEIEARACFRDPPPTGRKVFYVARSLDEVDPNRVRRLRSILEEEAPEWVEAIKIAADVYGDDKVSVVFWSGVPLEVGLAILQNLDGRRRQ